MEIIDTHAHLDAPEFSEDCAEVLQRAARSRVGRIICVGTSLESSRRCIELARLFPGRVWASVGIHPNHAAEAGPSEIREIASLALLPEVVAVGETGLDFYRQWAAPQVQMRFLKEHLALSLSVGKPLILHARKADEELIEIVREYRGILRGVRHCFDGSPEMADGYLAGGLHIGFGGAVTRPGHHKLKASARAVPVDRLLVETDCPYMTPAGAPADRNEPAFIVQTVEALAALRGIAPDKVIERTTDNAHRLFFGAMQPAQNRLMGR